MTPLQHLEQAITKKSTVQSTNFKFPPRYAPDSTTIVGIYYDSIIPTLLTISSGSMTLTTGVVLKDVLYVNYAPVLDSINLTIAGTTLLITRDDLIPTLDPTILDLQDGVMEQVLLYRTQVTLLLSLLPPAYSVDPAVLEFNGIVGSLLLNSRNILKELFITLHSRGAEPLDPDRIQTCHKLTRDLVTSITTGTHKSINATITTVLRRYLLELCTLSLILNANELTTTQRTINY